MITNKTSIEPRFRQQGRHLGRRPGAGEIAAPMTRGAAIALPAIALLAVGLSPGPTLADGLVNFKLESASQDARHQADWIVGSGDNRNMPFVIIDKVEAKVFVFYANGQLRGAARALLGLALGDTSVPGIGDRKLSSIRPDERTTPAGRFVATLGRNLHGEEILWVDYAAAISLHRVITTNLKEHRAQRLASPTSFDKRITYGCINVSVEFYETVVSPAFTGTDGIVYVLPEAN